LLTDIPRISLLLKKSLKIPKVVIRSRRWKKRENTMNKIKRTKGHTLIYKTASLAEIT
jgi:hypothetical protein